MAWVGGAFMLGSTLLGGAMSGSGQRDTNRDNERIARDNRKFQERMSNTAVSRRMKDLKKSGINPLLAGKYDATSPAGSIATMGNVGGAAVEGAKSGANIALTAKQGTLMKAQIQNVRADTAKKMSESGMIQSHEALFNAQTNTANVGLPGVESANKLAKANASIRRLEIPGVQAEHDLWKWLENADSGAIAKALGKSSGVAAQMIRFFMIQGLKGGKK